MSSVLHVASVEQNPLMMQRETTGSWNYRAEAVGLSASAAFWYTFQATDGPFGHMVQEEDEKATY